MTSDSTQINNDPSRVIAQRGMLSTNPTSSMMDTISLGNDAADVTVIPEESMIVVTIPWATPNRAIINSSPQVTGLDNAHDEEQHQQGIANGFQAVVDVQDHIPNTAAFEILRTGADQGPYLSQLIVPGV